MVDLTSPLPKEGVSIPVKATFGGFKKWLPRSAGYSHNNAFPVFRFYDGELECRVIRTVRRRYADIEAVDVLQSFGTNNLIIDWRDSVLNFAANVSDEDLRPVLKFFETKGVPLTGRARAVLVTVSS
jgi:hypothetical protein